MILKGEGSATERDLIVVSFDNQVTKDGKTRYLDVQMNREGLSETEKENSNLHLHSTSQTLEDGTKRYNNAVPYAMSQYDKLKEAAGDNVIRLESGAEVFAVKASLTKGSKGGYVINTQKPIEASEFKLDADVLKKQSPNFGVEAPAVAEPAVEEKPAKTRGRKKVADKVAETPAVDGPELG